MKIKIIVILIFTIVLIYFTDNVYCFEIKAVINNYQNSTIKIFAEKGEDNFLLDSTKTDKNGLFSIIKPEKLNSGIYKIEFDDKQYIEFIPDSDIIEIQADYLNLSESIQFKSLVNSDFYSYKKLKENFIKKMELLQPSVFNYPNDNDFYWKIQNEYLKIQIVFEKYCKDLIGKHSKNLLSKYILIDMPVIVNPELSLDSSVNFLKNHFFYNARFNDSNILNSSVLPDRIITYLALYMNKKLSKIALEAEYIKAVNYLMSLNYESDEIYNYVLEYLQDGFQKYHFEKVLEYISINYRYRNSCENEERRIQLQEKLDKISTISVGKPSPAIKTKDINGKEIDLKQVNADYTLIVFWASWCPHCKDLLNQLKEYHYLLPKDKLEILAISIDTEEHQLNEFLVENKYHWTIINEKGGWNSLLCEDFNIYATPTMILLDKDKIIISKPMSFEEFKKFLN